LQESIRGWALLILSYTERADIVRLISAREVTAAERRTMRKVESELEGELRPDYDWRSLRVRKLGPGGKRFGDVIRLEPDVADAFPDADAVVKRLRFLIRVTKENRNALRPGKGDTGPIQRSCFFFALVSWESQEPLISSRSLAQ
jgi:hypothetical protein